MSEPAKKSNVVLILIIVAAVAVILMLTVVGLGVMGYLSMKQYTTDTKKVEGKVTAGQIARGLIRCAEEENILSGKSGELPASSPAVTASVPRGAKYMSAPSDWASPAFTCAKFSMTTPQYFQYQWERVSAQSGVVHARADLDGDGVAEVNIEVPVRCSATGECEAGGLVEK